jgi:hypothetical protein
MATSTEAAADPLALLSDRALPALAEALDPDSAGRRLGALWRRRVGELGELRCARADTKYAPGERCVVSYLLEARGAAPPRTTFGVVEAGPGRLSAGLLEDDAALPGVAEALDGQRMQDRVAQALGGEVARCRAVPVRYKPGRSCVVRYEIGDGGRVLSVTDADGVVEVVLRELRHENEHLGVLDGVDPLF